MLGFSPGWQFLYFLKHTCAQSSDAQIIDAPHHIYIYVQNGEVHNNYIYIYIYTHANVCTDKSTLCYDVYLRVNTYVKHLATQQLHKETDTPWSPRSNQGRYPGDRFQKQGIRI